MPVAQAGPPPPSPNTSLAASPGSAPATVPVPGRGTSWEKEYRELEGSIKLRNYSPKTLAAYRLWVGKFQAFVRSRPTDQLGGDEVRAFLTELAVRQGVAASTQNQALAALLFLYRHVLERDLEWLDELVRAKRGDKLPVVLSRAEAAALLSRMMGGEKLEAVAHLIPPIGVATRQSTDVLAVADADLLRGRPARLGADLPEVRQRSRVLRDRCAGVRRRHHGQGPGPHRANR